MNAKQVPQYKQKQSYLPSLLYIWQKPGININYCLIVFIVYMPYIESCKMLSTWKKIDIKKKRGRGNQRYHIGSCPQVPVFIVSML